MAAPGEGVARTLALVTRPTAAENGAVTVASSAQVAPEAVAPAARVYGVQAGCLIVPELSAWLFLLPLAQHSRHGVDVANRHRLGALAVADVRDVAGIAQAGGCMVVVSKGADAHGGPEGTRGVRGWHWPVNDASDLDWTKICHGTVDKLNADPGFVVDSNWDFYCSSGAIGRQDLVCGERQCCRDARRDRLV